MENRGAVQKKQKRVNNGPGRAPECSSTTHGQCLSMYIDQFGLETPKRPKRYCAHACAFMYTHVTSCGSNESASASNEVSFLTNYHAFIQLVSGLRRLETFVEL